MVDADDAATRTMSVTLTVLPDEVIQAIIQNLDALSVASLAVTSRRFTDIANEPLLWKGFCQRDFRFWETKHDFKKKLRDPKFQGWKELYAFRCRVSKSTKERIVHTINNPLDRLSQIESVVNQGYDTKDTLLAILKDAPNSEDFLARRYWANLVLGSVHRSFALENWMRLQHLDDVIHPAEVGLAAMDMFVIDASENGDVDDTFSRLDAMVASVREANPKITEQTPRVRAKLVAEHLRTKSWVGIMEERRYQSVDNMFLGIALRSRHRNSLPLISAIIFCYICRQFDLRAQPCSFPLHVHALVQPPYGLDLNGNPLPSDHDNQAIHERTHLYMDPFNNSESMMPSDLQRQLRFITPHALPDHITSYLSPASPRELLARSARNILNSVTLHDEPPHHPIPVTDAAYAALFALVLFPTNPATFNAHVRHLTQHFMHFFTHDLHLYNKFVIPLTISFPDHLEYRKLCQAISEEEAKPKQARYRSREPYRVVEYKVGQMFRHRRRRYLAVIYGWDNVCKMSDEWIMGNQVDRLPKGRGQPFYHVLVDDATTRYVAQENIIPMGGDEIHESDVRRFSVEIGKWFRRFDPKTGIFISNIRDEYPED